MDFLLDDVGNSEGALGFRLEALGGDFFDEGEAWELCEVSVGVFDGQIFVEFKHFF